MSTYDITRANALQLQLNNLYSKALPKLAKHLQKIDDALKSAKVLTLLLYFAFAISLWLGDVMHLNTLITSFLGSFIGFLFYLVICALLAYVLAQIKHLAYVHMSYFGSVSTIVLLCATMGITAEWYTSSGNQSAKARNVYESSPEYQNLIKRDPLESLAKITTSSPLVINIPSPQIADTGRIEAELAKYRSYVEGCVKTCAANRAKVAALEAELSAAQQRNANAQSNYAASQQNAALAQQQAITAQQAMVSSLADKSLAAHDKRINDVKNESYNPIIRFVSDLFGVTIPTAVVIVMLFIAVNFEAMHYWLSKMRAEVIAERDIIEAQILKLEIEFFNLTRTHYTPPLDTVTPAHREDSTLRTGVDLNKPATASMGFIETPIDTSPRFKYQHPSTSEHTHKFVGFVDTNNLPIKAELPQPRSGGTGKFNPVLGTAEAVYELPLKEPTRLGQYGVPEAKADLGLLPRSPSRTGVAAPLAQGVALKSNLYKAWLADIHADHIKATATDARKWVQKTVAGKGSQARGLTSSHADIDSMVETLFTRACKDPKSGITRNPAFAMITDKNGKPCTNGRAKYLYHKPV